MLAEVAIHDHIGDHHRAVDRHAGSNLVLEPLLAFRLELMTFGF
jgi:hypothetical protein